MSIERPMSAGDRDTLAALLAEHRPRTVWEPSNYNDPTASHPIGVSCSCGWGVEGGNSDDLHRAHVADVLLGSDWLAEREAAAEQRGREDNADHGMCYVHGSKALAGVKAGAWDEGFNAGGVESKSGVGNTPPRGANPYRTTENTES